MTENFLERIGEEFEIFFSNLDGQDFIKIACLVFLILNLILAIILLKVSSQPFVSLKIGCNTKYEKNVPGMLVGIIVLIFSFVFLFVLMFGQYFINEFRGFFLFGIGGMFFFVLIMLIVAVMKNKDPETFSNFMPVNPTGICKERKQMGVKVQNKCYVKNVLQEEEADKCKVELKKCEEKSEKAKVMQEQKECKCNDKVDKFDSTGDKSKPIAEMGICEYKDDEGNRKFGYSHPAFGKKCVSGVKMAEMLKKNPNYGRIHNVQIRGMTYNPYQSTQCYGTPKNDLLYYDLKCKNKFGENYGVKAIEGFNCPDNDYRGMCEKDYQMGEKLETNSTKCVPLGTDMNMICNKKHLREKKSKFIRTGYKTIEFSGCPKGYQRALCDGNYYDGQQLFKNTTECFSQSFNPSRMCKNSFGPLAFSSRIISDNCTPGNIRAVCQNVSKN